MSENKKNENDKKNKLIKIIYFDEDSAIDYINISDGGIRVKSNETTNEKSDKGNINTTIGLESKFSFFDFFKANAKAEANAEILQYGQKIVKSTLTNTILTDYILKANDDEKTKKFCDFKIVPIENSLTFWKMYTPYTKLFNDKLSDKINSEIDITKLDQVIDSVKGYYELKAVKNNETYILRFNNIGFRNNYKLSNLMNMDLVYYGVLVGESTLEQYSIENEFNFTTNSSVSLEEIKGKAGENNKIKIYDVILAGVVDGNEK